MLLADCLFKVNRGRTRSQFCSLDASEVEPKYFNKYRGARLQKGEVSLRVTRACVDTSFIAEAGLCWYGGQLTRGKLLICVVLHDKGVIFGRTCALCSW